MPSLVRLGSCFAGTEADLEGESCVAATRNELFLAQCLEIDKIKTSTGFFFPQLGKLTVIRFLFVELTTRAASALSLKDKMCQISFCVCLWQNHEAQG